MATIKGLYERIDACNGEIRIMAARYRSGWYCLVAIIEVDDIVWERFEDLASGDNDFFDARDFFKAETDGNYVLSLGETPEAAMVIATRKAAALLKGYDH